MKITSGKTVLLLILLSTLSACKIVTEVPKGGTVEYRDGVVFCGQKKTCSIDVVDSFFEETFRAQPFPGNAFVSWQAGLCGGSDQPCPLTTDGFDKNESLVAWLESDKEILLTPQFSEIVKTVDCEDESAPSSLDDLINSSPDVRNASECKFASGSTSQALDSGIVFAQNGSGNLYLDYFYWPGGPSREVGVFGPGDFLLAVDWSESLGEFSSSEFAVTIYVDSDENPDTGRDSHGVLGADYRGFVTSCFTDLPEGFPGVPSGVDAQEPHSGYLQYWSDSDGRWKTVSDATYARKIAFPTNSAGWNLYLFTGFGSEGIGLPANIAVHLEKLGAECALPNRTKITEFVGLYLN